MSEFEKRPSREKVTLKVAGCELKLVSDDNEEYLIKLAREIDRFVTGMVVANTRINKIDAALYCALEYLDKYNRQQDELNAQRERIERILGEFALLKEENEELKTLLGGPSVNNEEKSDESESEKE